jgi:hypothetical protein
MPPSATLTHCSTTESRSNAIKICSWSGFQRNEKRPKKIVSRGRSILSQCKTKYALYQYFPSCGTHTLGSTQRTGWGYAKIILVMAENTKKKGVKIKTQKQSYEVFGIQRET